MADTTLQSFSKKVDESLVQPLRNILVGRRLVHVTPPAGFGISAVEWSKIVEMGEGMVSYAFNSVNVDKIGAEPTTSKIPVYWKDYSVDRREYEGFKIKNIDMDTSNALSASYVAALTEDKAIIDGVAQDGSAYAIDGLFQGAGNDEGTDLAWSTTGNATKSVANAYALLAADSVPVGDHIPYNLVVHPTPYMNLLKSRSTNGNREYPEVKEMLNGGEIIMSNSLPAATDGVLLPDARIGEPYVDFYLASDWRTEHGIDSEHPDTGDLSGRVYSAGILRIKQSNAICKLSDIN